MTPEEEKRIRSNVAFFEHNRLSKEDTLLLLAEIDTLRAALAESRLVIAKEKNEKFDEFDAKQLMTEKARLLAKQLAESEAKREELENLLKTSNIPALCQCSECRDLVSEFAAEQALKTAEKGGSHDTERP